MLAPPTEKVSHRLARMGYTEEQVRAVNFEGVVASRRLTDREVQKELQDVRDYSATCIELKVAGHDLMWHYFADKIFRVRRLEREDKATAGFRASFYDVMTGKDKKMLDYIVKRSLLPQNMKRSIESNLTSAYYFAKGAITTFRPTTAKSIYNMFRATHVLDPTAGWGGRIIGAYGLGIAYTGIDTNTDLLPGYTALMKDLNAPNVRMIWDSCLNVDFADIDYDCVLTSPPYINLESYEHMELFKTKTEFYKSFLIPLIEKCLKHIKRNGTVCFNISPDMYEELKINGFRACDQELIMPKNTNKKAEDIVNPEMIYCWKNAEVAPAPPVIVVPTYDTYEKDIHEFLAMMKAKYPEKNFAVNLVYTH